MTGSRDASADAGPRYTTLLLDLDHTLFDSDRSELLAFDATMLAVGVDEPRAHLAEYHRINRALWAAVERHEITPGEVRLLRFQQFLASTGIDADPAEMADLFARGLADHGELYPGALEVLDELAGLGTLALVTNGLSDVQRGRLERVGIADHFAAIVISAEVGASKPGTRIFDLTFELLGNPDRSGALMIGDSLTSDIRGGRAAGVATCWYDPHGSGAVPEHAAGDVDHRIDALAQLADVVRG